MSSSFFFCFDLFEEEKMAQKKIGPASELGVKDLAENYLEVAVAQLGALMKSDDAEIALQATQMMIGMARPAFALGGNFAGFPDDGMPNWPGGTWPGGGWRGGGRPGGGWPGSGWGWPGGLGGWGGYRTG
jgi:hypothetical protein